MILKLLYTFKKNVKFEQINNHLHSMFSHILFDCKSKNNRRSEYSFKITRVKEYYKDKTYEIYFNTSNLVIIDNLEKNISKYGLTIKDSLNSNLSNIIKITNLNFELFDVILKNWGIESDLIGNKRRIDYKKEFSIPMLQELIELQVFLNLEPFLKNRLTSNCLSKNNKPYYNFINNIILGSEHRIKIKDSFITAYDVIINIKEDKKSKLLANELIHNGVGAKNSFGCGYAEYYKL